MRALVDKLKMPGDMPGSVCPQMDNKVEWVCMDEPDLIIRKNQPLGTHKKKHHNKDLDQSEVSFLLKQDMVDLMALLPEKLVHSICSLADPASLLNLSMANKRMKRIIDENMLWRKLWLEHHRPHAVIADPAAALPRKQDLSLEFYVTNPGTAFGPERLHCLYSSNKTPTLQSF